MIKIKDEEVCANHVRIYQYGGICEVDSDMSC